MSIVDLHAHSVYSDGSDTPKELIDKALELGISAIALTDHNTVAGLPEFLDYAKDKPIEAVSGCEFSVDYNGVELHILGLFIPTHAFGRVNNLLQEYTLRKEQSNRRLIDNLRCKGYDLDYDKIAAKTKGNINRAHIATELVSLGCEGTVRQIIEGLLSPENGLYTPPVRHTAFEMIRFIHSIGAVAVLAHPFLNLDEARLRQFLAECKDVSLDGMECFYSLYDDKLTRLSEELCREFGVLPSGGSDYHGKIKPDTFLGTGRNNIAVAVEYFNALKDKRATYMQK